MVSSSKQSFQGVLFNITYFKTIESELVKYQLTHPQECIPIIPFFNEENKKILDNFYVSDITPAKSYDEYMFNIINYGFPHTITIFLAEHPEWSQLVIKYD
ncbi:hypothetical protein [Methanosphaera sp. WGK6]|uniref:hypothetical protein n=1 Tax=Methanosphaera sp. WGK6 TaxID=1561964 RepID=UPI00084C1A48|nr:hypothetical protein [Methanosphaera sp. WGK6]OED29689.1 hypothetical protein NL43_06790 [Methanosphaera sp. WGK6]